MKKLLLINRFLAEIWKHLETHQIPVRHLDQKLIFILFEDLSRKDMRLTDTQHKNAATN